jgi:hypothetical protein
MAFTEQEYDEIEGYLSGQMTEADRQAVMARMKTDPEFLQKVQHQFGVKVFLQQRYDELRLLQVLDERTMPEVSMSQTQRMRNLLAPYLKLVAMIALGLGIGWLLFGRGSSSSGDLLLSRHADRIIFPNTENGFGDQDSVVSKIVIQAFNNRDFVKNSFIYRNDSLRLYNAPKQIINSVRLDLIYSNRAYRLKTDDANYLLKETELGRGILDPIP